MNRAQVNNQSAYNYYPVHIYGRLADRHSDIVTKHVIPYLAKELQQAVKDEDSQKVLVNVRALGNLGHQQILSVFEPYLEGEVQVTPFQRLAMVVAMDRLAENNPPLARLVQFYSRFTKTSVKLLQFVALLYSKFSVLPQPLQCFNVWLNLLIKIQVLMSTLPSNQLLSLLPV